MKIVAHRGFSGKYPENTLKAFEGAFNHPEFGKKIIGLETDIQLSSDNQIVIYHDIEIEISGKKVPVGSLSHRELVEAAKPKLRGENVCLLEDLLKLSQHRTELLIEIKAGKFDYDIFIDKLSQVLERYSPVRDEIILHSFSSEIMEKILSAEGLRGLKYGVLCSSAEGLEKFDGIMDRIDYVHPSWKGLLENPDVFAAANRPFHVWTVNSKDIFEKITQLPCSNMIRGIMTDELDVISR
ncbi:MAG: hypothetical protein A2020_14265 [Lentisphaerae bacterium GWF2_45_14]|nr:MAG: hypothetical protein A2020_14265 [Lentisphaerae bacterium GWF2_45_14]